MFNTPIGHRAPFDGELQMLQISSYKLYKHIMARIYAEDKDILHEGFVINPVKESSVFHGVKAKLQLYLLHQTCLYYFDRHELHTLTQFSNSTLECIYSCLLNEIRLEILTQKQNTRTHIYYVLSEFDGQMHRNVRKSLCSSTDIKEWINIIDKLASKSVYDQNFAKSFEVGFLPEVFMYSKYAYEETILIADAEHYFEQFSYLIKK